MTHARRPSGKEKGSPSKKRTVSLDPLFVDLDDGSIPFEINEETIQHLRRNMAAWTTLIDRLSLRTKESETKFYVARAVLRRGVAHTLLSEWQAAALDLSQVIAMRAGEAMTNTAYVYRAQTYDGLGQDEASMRDWTQVLMIIEHASSHPERFSKELAAQGYAYRARLFCRQEDYKQAIADCDRALAFHHGCAEAYSVRGRAYSLIGKWTAALADCTKAIELEGWSVHYYRRGLVHKQIGNYDQALADFEWASQCEPENVLFRRERADLLMLRLVHMGVYTPSSSAFLGVNAPHEEV